MHPSQTPFYYLSSSFSLHPYTHIHVKLATKFSSRERRKLFPRKRSIRKSGGKRFPKIYSPSVATDTSLSLSRQPTPDPDPFFADPNCTSVIRAAGQRETRKTEGDWGTSEEEKIKKKKKQIDRCRRRLRRRRRHGSFHRYEKLDTSRGIRLVERARRRPRKKQLERTERGIPCGRSEEEVAGRTGPRPRFSKRS